MKNWREAPHLFANGKFKVRVLEQGYVGADNDYSIENIIGVMYTDELETNKKSEVKINDCTLIARPISDMSDEECDELRRMQPYTHNIYPNNIMKEMILSNSHQYSTLEVIDVFLYLLSIGVYPFNQDNPKDVIWRYENE